MRLATTAALATVCACAPDASLRLVAHDVGPSDGARLNQPIVLTFSATVDPGSVGPASVRVLRVSDGAAVDGRFVVDGVFVRFLPTVACLPDLKDGAMQPGERYRVEVPGLPVVACVRSLEGALLEAGERQEFATVNATLDAPPEQLFVDTEAGIRPLSDLAATMVDGRARIHFSKPLDPRSLAEAKFWLRGPWSFDARATENPLLKATLVENDPAAVFELSVNGPLPLPLDANEKSYSVEMQLSKLRDFSGTLLAPDKGTNKLVRLTVATKEKREKP